MKKISIITPCFNEELTILKCISEVRYMMSTQLPTYDYEHIISDNASTDSTLELLEIEAAADLKIKVLVNSRNVGPFRNMWSGMKHSTGDAIIPLLPADLQDPVHIIPKFVKEWENGAQIVYGVRTHRQESFLLRKVRTLYYKIIRKFAQINIPINAGEFLLADRRVTNSVLQTDDEYPYIRGLFAQTAVKSASIEYIWESRQAGKSKNNLFSLADQAINGFVSTNKVMARLALVSGFFFAFLGLLVGLVSAVVLLFNRNEAQNGIPTLIVGMFFLGGIQLIFLGMIGEYVLSINNQVRKSPKMYIDKSINF